MDDEIIKALMCCGGENFEDDCPKCPLYDDGNCNCNLAKYSLDLINRKNAEIEKLKKENEILSRYELEIAKDFVERLRNRVQRQGFPWEDNIIFETDIDEVLKEMESENKW